MKNKPKFCRERQHSPKLYDKRSFRTVPRGKRGVKQIMACRKGFFKRGRCKKQKGRTAFEVQSILYPEGSDPRCKRGEGGKELKRAKRHKNPKGEYIGHFSQHIVKQASRLLKDHGFEPIVQKSDKEGVYILSVAKSSRRALNLILAHYEEWVGR